MYSKHIILPAVFLSILLAFCLAFPPAAYAASIRYATPDGSTTADCLSWANACTLQRAISTATSGAQIWVEMGTHTPASSGSRTSTFTLKNGVSIYGGFDGTETSLDARNWEDNQTILDGDLNDNGIDDNDAYHVVTASSTDSTAVLDGFTITGGNANYNQSGYYSGSGINILNGSPTLRNLIITENSAGGLGGGIYLYYSNPSITHVTFLENISSMYGGGACLYYSSPTLSDVTFEGNTVNGGSGGAMYLFSSSPVLNDVVFTANIAIAITSGSTSAGGSGGGMYLSYGDNPQLTNVIFNSNNAGGFGGALDIETGSAVLTNVSFYGNGANFGGGAISVTSSSLQIRNSILWGDTANYGSSNEIYSWNTTPSYTNVLIQGGGGTIDADPLYVDPGSSDFHLRPASPALNYGNNSVTSPALPATDLDGASRIADGTVDLGAYENQGPYNNAPVLSGNPAGQSMLEDPASSPDSQVSSLLSGLVTDSDGTAGSAGMAVTAADNSGGDWQYSLDSGTTWTALGTVSDTSATLLGPDALLRFAPAANWNGTATLIFRAWDVPPDLRDSGTSGVNSSINGGRTSFSASTGTFSMVVTAVNDAPFFSAGASQVSMSTSGAATVNDWATGISAGANNESGQTLNFIVTNDNNALFSVQPSITADGTLSYTPVSRTSGSATVSVSLHDDGGTADGGTDTSAAQTFTIAVTQSAIFVDQNATGNNNGTSWVNAYTDLQTAIDETVAGFEIWVAKGTYTPGSAGENNATFNLKEGLYIYGGFAGTETTRSERDWKYFSTILSGDLNGNATFDSSDAYHVVSADGLSSATVLDGFTITGGYATGATTNTGVGGGIFLNETDLTLSNLRIIQNMANNGAGMYLYESSPTLSNILFKANEALTYGGGIFSIYGSPICNNLAFLGNTAVTGGGGILFGQGDPILTNNTFYGNSAGTAGGAVLLSSSSPQIRNSILWGNTAASDSEISLLNAESVPVFTNVILDGGGGALDIDPLFMDAVNGDLRLQAGSPAINAGDNSVSSPSLLSTDIDGFARIANGTVDLGAYEVENYWYVPMVSNTTP